VGFEREEESFLEAIARRPEDAAVLLADADELPPHAVECRADGRMRYVVRP